MTGNEDDFVGEFETKRSDDGYGLVMDKGSVEKQEMGRHFDEPEVGAPMEEPEIETADLPAITEESAPVPVADSLAEGESVVDAAPAVASPVADSEVKGETLPAAEPAKGMSFGERFAKARLNGEKTFEWKNPKTGKTQIFTSQLKSEKAKKPATKAAPAVEAAPVEESPSQIAEAVFKLQDDVPAGPVRSTGGIGPDLNPAMQPKPGAKSIYANVGVSAPQKQVAPINVTGKDGAARPADSVAEVIAARKGARGG